MVSEVKSAPIVSALPDRTGSVMDNLYPQPCIRLYSSSRHCEERSNLFSIIQLFSTHNRLLYIRYSRLRPQSFTAQTKRRKPGHTAPAGNQQHQS